jgi:hypothetical protein
MQCTSTQVLKYFQGSNVHNFFQSRTAHDVRSIFKFYIFGIFSVLLPPTNNKLSDISYEFFRGMIWLHSSCSCHKKNARCSLRIVWAKYYSIMSEILYI